MDCWYIELYQILERIRPMAYWLALPLNLSKVCDVFHVSQLEKYVSDPDAVIETNQSKVLLNITIAKHLVRIVDSMEKNFRKKTICQGFRE